MIKTVFSGIQPTSKIHIGNYFGAINNWVNLQKNEDYTNIYCVVDMHAITVFQDPLQLRDNSINTIITLMACGIDINKSLIFLQSTNHYHSELTWILNCIARVGWLSRMTQFKDKAGKNKEKSSVGLYVYPVLQAADVLLYNSDYVPVGQDQKQHVELIRDIAIRFNNDYGKTFNIPEPLISNNNSRILSLQDGSKKMSKSGDEISKINIFDSKDDIVRKISKAKTDSFAMPSNLNELKDRYEIDNLINIFSLCSSLPKNKVIEQYVGKGYAQFKQDLSEVIINYFDPIRNKYDELLSDQLDIVTFIEKSAKQSISLTSNFIKNIRQKIGFLL